MENTKVENVRKKWLIAFGLTLVHPLLLVTLFPIIGEPANLVIFISPLIATWLFSWRIGIPIAFLNTVVTAVVFSILGGQGADSRPMGIAFFLVVSALCFALGLLKRFLGKNKRMAEELDNLRRS